MAKFKFTGAKKDKSIRLFGYEETFKNAKKFSGAKIEMLSNREISVDGCRGITEYNDSYVKLKIIGGLLIISGKGLQIPIFEKPIITVTGIIENIELCIR
ncbi:MAG: YabP/YqfC family sporulation protein [Clostridia bacterium]|nr:YabP/YqfC family sporulation protein [Clostridia bacterium]